MNSKTLFAISSSVICGLGLWGYSHFYRQKKVEKGAVVKELYIYPVKSCAGIKVDNVEIEKIGVLFDRSWVLVNSKGIIQTMRQIPKLALVKPSFEGMNYLCLDAPGMRTLKLDVDIDESKGEKRIFEISFQHGEGVDCGDEAGKWFDEFLGKPCHRLFSGRCKSLKRRKLKEGHILEDSVHESNKMSFTDDAPVMMTSEGSLQLVNKELEDPVDIRSFRPNIYIEGCSSFEEDSWNRVKIGNVLLRRLRNCFRCTLTTVNMDSGIRRKNGEPLETLKRIRVSKDDDKKYNQKPSFGSLFVVERTGTINVGDNVIVFT